MWCWKATWDLAMEQLGEVQSHLGDALRSVGHSYHRRPTHGQQQVYSEKGGLGPASSFPPFPLPLVLWWPHLDGDTCVYDKPSLTPQLPDMSVRPTTCASPMQRKPVLMALVWAHGPGKPMKTRTTNMTLQR